MSQRRYAANHLRSCRWVASCKLRRATCNRQPSQTARRTSHVASLCPGLWTDHRQRRRRLHVARRTSHHCAQGYGLGCRSACESASRNPRAAIRELWASRKPQLADCSSQHRGQACAEARLQLARHRSQLADRGAGSPFLRSQRAPRSSQGADFCAGGPRLTLFSSRRIADHTVADRSTLARRSRLTLFSSRRIADRTVADRSTLARRSRQRSTVVRTLAVRWSQGAGV